MVAFGVLIAFITVVTAFDAARSLTSVVDPDVRRRLSLHVIATLLRGAGLLGVVISQAVAFRDWSTFVRPFMPIPGVERSRRVVRRMDRQIDGREDYRSEEVRSLRELATRRLAGGGSVLSTVSLMVFSLGMALSPLTTSPLEGPTILGHAFQVLGGILLVALTPVC